MHEDNNVYVPYIIGRKRKRYCKKHRDTSINIRKGCGTYVSIFYDYTNNI